MPSFSQHSLDHLSSCDERLQRVLFEAIKRTDFSVICGHRGEDDQNRAVALGTSQLRWPRSKHNALPSLAADCVPYPVDWGDLTGFHLMATTVKQCAAELGVEIVWGGDWEILRDHPHFELPLPIWPPTPGSEQEMA